MSKKFFTRGLSLLLIAVVFVIVPAAAVGTAAVYGSTSGFLPDRHTDQVTVVYTLPGHSGGLFDQTVSDFTDPSVDIIFIGNDAEFSSQTASALEQAVWDGKVLVIAYPATGKFGDSLPVTPASTAPGSSSLVVTSLNNGIAREVFSDLNRTFTAPEPAPERLTGSIKPGSVSLLTFNTGDPALVYREYGKGYVVEWMLPSPGTYLGEDDADIVNFRIITTLLATVKGTGSTVTTAFTTTEPTTLATAVPTTEQTKAVSTTGNAIIQSSPLGASVYIDGVFAGKTPLQLEGITPGYHSVRMTRDGYYDFDGSAYIVKGETITVFGSLPEKEPQATAEKTAQPTAPTLTPALTTPAPTPTASAGDAIANPTVIAAGIGIVTAGIGAYATIYTHKNKEKKE